MRAYHRVGLGKRTGGGDDAAMALPASEPDRNAETGPVPLHERLRIGKRERLANLSDGVFAIAALLTANSIGSDLGTLSHSLFSYAVTFFVIAVFWWVNRDLLNRVETSDAPLTVIVLALLCTVGGIPLAARIAFAAPSPAASRFYAETMVAAGVLNCGQWLYVALRKDVSHDDLPQLYVWTRVGTTATLPLIFAPLAAFPARVPLWTVPVAIVVVIAFRQVMRRWAE